MWDWILSPFSFHFSSPGWRPEWIDLIGFLFWARTMMLSSVYFHDMYWSVIVIPDIHDKIHWISGHPKRIRKALAFFPGRGIPFLFDQRPFTHFAPSKLLLLFVFLLVLLCPLRPPPLCWSSRVTEDSMGSRTKGVWFRLKIKVRIYEWELEERAPSLESESNRMVLP